VTGAARAPAELESFSAAALEADFDHDLVHVVDLDLSGQRADGGAFERCRLARVDLGESRLRRIAMRDVDLETVYASNGDWTGARLRGVTVRDCRLTGLDLGGAELRDVIFENCQLGWASFRFADADEVVFRDCTLNEADFQGAKIRRSRFTGCRLLDVDFTSVELADVDLRGSALRPARGHLHLRGATIDTAQLVELAPELAHELGILVDDT